MTDTAAAIPADFDIAWEPADAQLQWEWDDMHWPSPLAPLAMDFGLLILEGINASYVRFGAPFNLRVRFIAGYAYMAMDYGVPDDEVKGAFDQLRDAHREFAPDNARYWRDEALPALREIYRFVDEIDVDNLLGSRLADAWEAAWDRITEAWRIHFVAIRGAYRSSEDLSDFYEQVVPGAAPGEAMALIGGGNDVLQDVEAGIELLVDAIGVDPRLADRLRARPLPDLDEIAALAPERADEIRRFLDEHGHLGQAFDDLALPSWAEEPSILLAEIAKRLVDSPERQAHRRARLRHEAERLLAAARERVASRPHDRAELERRFELASEIGPLTEVHNYWIDRMSQAHLRRLAFRIGRRLAHEGSISEPSDVLYLHRAEVTQLLRAPEDRRSTIAERRAEQARQRTLKAPSKLGRAEPDFGLTSRFDVPREQAGDADELKGTGASAGVVRGPARVALGSEDFERIQRGDIIVCPSSNPSWVPVFAIAGGLVTNTGGVLAHAAVVAREFGLPAVVGVAGATDKIADGRMVEIDGTAGTVRLL
jgi:phosphohistidine swiveling domain-containing protein